MPLFQPRRWRFRRFPGARARRPQPSGGAGAYGRRGRPCRRRATSEMRLRERHDLRPHGSLPCQLTTARDDAGRRPGRSSASLAGASATGISSPTSGADIDELAGAAARSRSRRDPARRGSGSVSRFKWAAWKSSVSGVRVVALEAQAALAREQGRYASNASSRPVASITTSSGRPLLPTSAAARSGTAGRVSSAPRAHAPGASPRSELARVCRDRVESREREPNGELAPRGDGVERPDLCAPERAQQGAELPDGAEPGHKHARVRVDTRRRRRPGRRSQPTAPSDATVGFDVVREPDDLASRARRRATCTSRPGRRTRRPGRAGCPPCRRTRGRPTASPVTACPTSTIRPTRE